MCLCQAILLSNMSEPIRALEFYCGIGGLRSALARSSIGANATVVRAFDWDQTATAVYTENHGPGIAHRVDIGTLDANTLEQLNANLWLLSPPCQPYTVLNQKAKGATDPRAQSFLHLVEDVLPALAERGAAPVCLLLENVAGFEVSSTRVRTLVILTKLGFVTRELLLTPLQFGVPNSRLRYYLLASRLPGAFSSSIDSNRILRHIPGHGSDWSDARSSAASPQMIESPVRTLRDYLDGITTQSAYAVPERVLMKWGRLFDIVLPSAKRTCCFTRGYTQLVERSGSILQENEELDTAETFEKFQLAQASGDGRAVEILRPLRLRYFSPEELLRLSHFEELGSESTFRWPESVSTKAKYRLLGNSVNVRVKHRICRPTHLHPSSEPDIKNQR
ncbi:S-adenosyl-L-methionine-dependent methyltransferase [Russula earlei]|uniref:S-adenosyl-L-methionine-dependent methyltransferase n=1 Tax=Russula earlei TaxID=71964 RepID=A0ACC0UGN3_9AGAM|nr:S-adenosyl-L-methionine-dependent methyltransferase [Russula earlei]